MNVTTENECSCRIRAEAFRRMVWMRLSPRLIATTRLPMKWQSCVHVLDVARSWVGIAAFEENGDFRLAANECLTLGNNNTGTS